MNENLGDSVDGAAVFPPGPGIRYPMAGWLQEIVPYGIFTTDRELRITNWNDWLSQHSGHSAREVIGRKLTDLYPDIESRRFLARYERALEGEVSILSAALHKYLLPLPVTVAESGLPFMLQSARIAPVPGDAGTVGTITIIEDVTQREHQAAILRRQQRLDQILSEALGTLLQSQVPSQEMEAIFGRVRLALGLDTQVSHLISPNQENLQLHSAVGLSPKQRESIASIAISADALKVLRKEITIDPSHPSFSTFNKLGLRGQWIFPLTVGDRPIGLATFGSYERESISTADITVLTRITRYVAIAIDRVRREDDTVAASRAKDDFLAALSHELRTPLNPVLLLASESAADPTLTPELRQIFDMIAKNVMLEAHLIDDLLDLTRITRGKLVLDIRPVAVRQVLEDAIANVKTEVTDKNLLLTLDIGPDEPVVHGDPVRLQQVFWNVLKNAAKFTPPGGSIRVTCRHNTQTELMTIEITDTGAGMTSGEIQRIFDAFAQGDHASAGSSHRFGGLGLGLAISRSLVEIHSGTIRAASPGLGHGSTFTIELPIAPALILDRPASRVATPPFRGTGAPFPGLRILLVEDHAPTRAILTQLLLVRNYLVVPASSVAEALKFGTTQDFDLLITDIGLPDGNGYELMEELGRIRGLRGIALTGYGAEQDIARAQKAGFVAHLTKPISVRTLDGMLDSLANGRLAAAKIPSPTS